MDIAFNRPGLAGRELSYIADAVARGRLAGDGRYTRACEAIIAQRCGGAALLTHSCTAALEMAMLLLDLTPGDEVILPSYTFVSTANAIALRGATPVFVDIRRDTLNIDETLIEAAITPRTRAIVAVHYAGLPCEMDAIAALADAHGIAVVEDAAQAYGSRYRGRPAGALGDYAAFSFHETKNVVAGEGGALVVRDPARLTAARIVRDKGTNRDAFLRGTTDRYTWVALGSSYLPSEIVAAFLLAQIEDDEAILRTRRAAWAFYADALRDLTGDGYGLPSCPDHITHNGHLFYLLAPTPRARDALIAQMSADGIETPFHYVPLHDAPFGRAHARMSGAMTVTDDVAARLLRLPLYRGIAADAPRVVERLRHHIRAMG